jgi:NRPS condensation-like uncharacterized protein
MLHWSELHPYNAAHVYKIAGPLRPERLKEAIDEAYWFNGIGAVEIDEDGVSYHHEPDEAPEIPVLQGGDDPEAALAAQLTRDLNRPFDRPRCQPIRYSAVDAGPSAHYVAATYDHWVADSVAARLILRHVLGGYCDLALPENEKPLDLYPGTYRDAFSHELGAVRVSAAATRVVTESLRNHSCARVAYSSAAQMAVQCELRRVGPDTVARLRRFARSLGATVHDVILAALGRAMADFLPRRSRHNPKVALGTIVDTRADAQADLANSHGTFLGYYVVRCRPDESTGLGDLTQRVADATQPIKAGRRYLDSLVNMQIINAIWPHLCDATKPHFMRKALPLVAGVSNVFLRDTWMGCQGATKILDFFRVAPTGPSVPLVLTPTTFGGQMNLGVTYRATGFTRARIDGILDAFLDQIERAGNHKAATVGRARRDQRSRLYVDP